MATIDPTTGAIGYKPGEQFQGGMGTYNFNTRQYDLPNSRTDVVQYNPNGAPTSIPTNFSSSPSKGSAPTPYAVVTSDPATKNYNGIQQDYQQNIAPRIQTSQQTTQANSQLPVISGYNVTANQTGNQGEQKATNPTTGQTYYLSPQTKPGLSATDVQGIIGDTSSSSSTGGGTSTGAGTPPANQSTAITNAQAGETAENTSYQANVSAETNVITQGAQTFQSIINSLTAGGMPLTPAQQSLVDATNNAFNQMTTQANLKAAALSSETGGVSNKVNEEGGTLLQIATDQAAAIAKMEVGFQQENFDEKYKTVTTAYAAWKDGETAKLESLTKIHDSVMSQYQSAIQVAQAQQTFAEAQYKDKASLAQSQFEFRDLKDSFGNTIGTQVFDKATGAVIHNVSNGSGTSDPTTGTLGVVTTNPNTGAVDPASQKAFLATIPTAYQAMVQGIANGKIEPPSARTKQGAQILSWVARYDPTLADGSGGFDATKYAARLTMQKSLASYSSGSYGAAIVSANKLVSHLASFTSSVGNLGNGSLGSTINSLGKAVELPLAGFVQSMGIIPPGKGLQAISQTADTEKSGLQDEMAKFFKGTGSTDVKSVEDWGNTLDPNATPGKQAGMVQGSLNLFTGQLDGFIQQYTTVMGHAPDMGTILQPQTLQTLSKFKNAGFNVDLPGVYYTDKDAYFRYGGGSAESMTSAYKALQAAGIPTTPENILQAAQI